MARTFCVVGAGFSGAVVARASTGVSFLGRLGTYRYLDMDVTIHEALLACEQIESILASNGAQALPAFFTPRP
ncbi:MULTISPECIES: hypothetical protein [Acetobacter]|uniref:hypothetical protein n=1 Tax=Acetobacter TaxID=434 RepID=UPI00377005CC